MAQIPQLRLRRLAKAKATPTPGRMAAGVSLAAAAAFGGYAASHTMTTPAPVSAAPAAPLQLSEIPRAQFPDALGTMARPPQVQAALDREDKSCPIHLAYVTIAADPAVPAPPAGAPPPSVRIVSGGYVSPVFALGAAPQRVAIPYPAPFSVGHGVISVIATGGAQVALLPVWHVGAGPVQEAQVSWAPGPACERPF